MNGASGGSAITWLLGILPLAVFGLLYATILRRRRDWREAWIIAATGWGTLVTLVTELLGQFRCLTAAGLAAAWLLMGIVLVAGLRFGPVTLPARGAPRPEPLRWPWSWKLGGGLLGVWLAGLGLVALTAAPNTFDAMTYHLPRVMHWIQNRQVGPYPTAIQRQVYLGPWAEYAILQFQLLLGTDRLANAVQWFALVSGIAGVSLIARQLGASPTGQLLAAGLTATIPMAVLQSTSPQTDLVAACWLVSAVWFILKAIETGQTEGRRLGYTALAGLALGHGILTKATIYCFGLAPCLWLAVALLRQRRRRAFLPLAVFAVLVLAVNLPDYVRQTRTYHSPFGPGEEAAEAYLPAAPYANAIHTPGTVVSNCLRNAALELVTPSRFLTRALESATRALLQRLGIDPDDPRTTWEGTVFALNPTAWANENHAGSPLHFLLILAAGVAVAIRTGPGSSPRRIYALILLGGGIVFCFLLRWTIWSTRLHLPLLVLGMPLVGLVLGRFRSNWPAICAALLAFGLAVPVALHNTSRPLVGPNAYYRLDRIDQYYLTGAPDLARIHREFSQVVLALKGTRIGLRLGRDDWEYPLWLRLRATGLNPRIEHVDVDNPSAQYAASLPPFEPDLTINIQQTENRVYIVRGKDQPAP
jgi:hypothetical protein